MVYYLKREGWFEKVQTSACKVNKNYPINKTKKLNFN